MLEPTRQLLEGLRRTGHTIVASLPDKWVGDLVSAVAADPDFTHVPVTREDEGVGLCVGAYLGGRRGALVCQNAGLLLAGNALAGYAHLHQIPMLILCAYRGRQDDAYYYQTYKGRVTPGVLDGLQVPYRVVETPDRLGELDDLARMAFLYRTPVVMLLSQRALGADQMEGGG
jgi:sulfopyruvate decarboxylase subunit alpha